MKKLLSLIMLGASALSMSAAMQVDQPALANEADSLAFFLGATQGASYNHQISRQASSPEQYAKVRKNYLSGLQAALQADTSAVEYYDGFNAGRSIVEAFKEMKSNGFPVNIDLFNKTFSEAFLNDDITAADVEGLMQTLQQLMTPVSQTIEQNRASARDNARQASEMALNENLAKGKQYIDSLTAADKKYVTTQSGLVYKITKKGKGDTLRSDQKADVRYTGKFVDGRVFDSSGDRTVTFGPSDVIKGFGEGLMLLNKGAKATLVIPAELAYGNQAPPVIGPGQTLVFEIEVVDVH